MTKTQSPTRLLRSFNKSIAYETSLHPCLSRRIHTSLDREDRKHDFTVPYYRQLQPQVAKLWKTFSVLSESHPKRYQLQLCITRCPQDCDPWFAYRPWFHPRPHLGNSFCHSATWNLFDSRQCKTHENVSILVSHSKAHDVKDSCRPKSTLRLNRFHSIKQKRPSLCSVYPFPELGWPLIKCKQTDIKLISPDECTDSSKLSDQILISRPLHLHMSWIRPDNPICSAFLTTHWQTSQKPILSTESVYSR